LVIKLALLPNQENKEPKMAKSGGGKSSGMKAGSGGKPPAGKPVPNLPSKTGEKSGGGRGNAPPGKK
jgi:hypothetical protein